jgi:hypothetical protein
MKVEVNDADIAVIERNSKAILMSSQRHLYVVDKVKFEESQVDVKKLFKKTKETKTVKFLVEAEVLCYNARGKFVGVLNEEATERFMRWYNLDALRQNWRDFKEELLAFDLEIKKVEKVESPEEQK